MTTATLERLGVEIVDEAVDVFVELLDPPPVVAWEVERLIRIGACRGLISRDAACVLVDRRPRTLSRELGRQGLPGVATLVAWGRLVVAMSVWEPRRTGDGNGRESPVSLDDVASRFGYPGGVQLSQHFARRVGMYPATWHETDGTVEGLCRTLVEHWRSRP